MAMLRVTLNDSFVVPLFREEMLFIQDEFEQLFSWYVDFVIYNMQCKNLLISSEICARRVEKFHRNAET